MTNENKISINQNVAILIDGNNIERSIHSESNDTSSMLNIDELVPELLRDRQLNRMVYFREGKKISEKLNDRFQKNYHGSVVPCHKSADIPLTIKATQLASKVDTIIIMSGDSDFVELVTHLQAMGVRVEIAAVKSTTSRYLLEVADQFHEITQKHWFTFGKKRTTFKPKSESLNDEILKQSSSKDQSDNSKSSNVKSAPSKIIQSDEQRLEQSKRDKERNKKIREERARNLIDPDIGNKAVEVMPESKLADDEHEDDDVNGNLVSSSTLKKPSKKVTKKAAKKVASKVAKKKVAKKVTKKVTKKKVSKKVAKKVSKKA